MSQDSKVLTVSKLNLYAGLRSAVASRLREYLAEGGEEDAYFEQEELLYELESYEEDIEDDFIFETILYRIRRTWMKYYSVCDQLQIKGELV